MIYFDLYLYRTLLVLCLSILVILLQAFFYRPCCIMGLCYPKEDTFSVSSLALIMQEQFYDVLKCCLCSKLTWFRTCWQVCKQLYAKGVDAFIS